MLFYVNLRSFTLLEPCVYHLLITRIVANFHGYQANKCCVSLTQERDTQKASKEGLLLAS